MYNTYSIGQRPEGPPQLILEKRSWFREGVLSAYGAIASATGHWLCCKWTAGNSFYTRLFKWSDARSVEIHRINITREDISVLHRENGQEDWWPGDPEVDTERSTL